MVFLKGIMQIASFTMNFFQYYRCDKARRKTKAMETQMEDGFDGKL